MLVDMGVNSIPASAVRRQARTRCVCYMTSMSELRPAACDSCKAVPAGMTNRPDLLDEALTRPGRIELKVEIGLPDEEGRLQILKIHTGPLIKNSFLAQDVSLPTLAERTKNFTGALCAAHTGKVRSHAGYMSVALVGGCA